MERVATKADIIPLHQPIQLANGQVSHQAVVEPGQVQSSVKSVSCVKLSRDIDCDHPDYRCAETRLRLGRW